MSKLRVFVCGNHQGHHLQGVSVVLAQSEQQARELLLKSLDDEFGHFANHRDEKGDLRLPDYYELRELALEPGAHMLFNGNY